MGVIEERIRKRKQVIREVDLWARKLRFKCTVVIIGSYARGDFNEWSDIDIVLISDNFKENPVQRLKKIDFPANFEVIPLNLRDLDVLFSKRDVIAEEICKYGVFVRDDYRLKNKLCRK